MLKFTTQTTHHTGLWSEQLQIVDFDPFLSVLFLMFWIIVLLHHLMSTVL